MSAGQGPPEDGSLEAAASQSKTSTLWELSLCSRHSHPHMAQASRSIAAIPIEGEYLWNSALCLCEHLGSSTETLLLDLSLHGPRTQAPLA